MSFGPIMEFKVGELQIELAPLSRETMGEFVSPGIQQVGVIKYLSSSVARTIQDEEEWFDKVRIDETRLVWGIWVVEDGERKLIGNSELNHIRQDHTRQATTGSMIFRQEYWGRGIASASHKARTRFAFQHLGLQRLESAVIQGNDGSLKALTRTGYYQTHVTRNHEFVDGKMRHLDNLECLNPDNPFWNNWWNGDRPTKRSLEARDITRSAMEWAAVNVTLP